MQKDDDASRINLQNSQHSASTDNDSSLSDFPSHDEALVSWTASEYISHKKNASWFISLGAVVAILTILVYVLTGDLVSSVAVGIAGILFGAFANRKPEVRRYELHPAGLAISGKLFPYEMFRSFALHEVGALRSIFLVPTKRFMAGITIYYPPEQEDEIVKTLSDYLPLEDRDPDMIDKLMSRVRY